MKRFVSLFLCLTLFSIFFMLLKSEKGAISEISLKSDSFIEGLKIVNKKNGKTNWILTAKRADIPENGDRAILSDIEMRLENDDITLSAGSGIYDLINRNVVIENTVIARNSQYSIMASAARIDGKTGYLESGSDVTIVGRNFKLNGTGMAVNNGDQTVRILKDVQATFHN